MSRWAVRNALSKYWPREVQKNLRYQMLRSHLGVAGLGLGALGVALFVVICLRGSALQLTNVTTPTMRHSMVLKSEVQKSLAALRGWVVLEDPAFRVERARAWADAIEPTLKKLLELDADKDNQAMTDRLARLKSDLRSLKSSQWWVEDVANAEGNEPAIAILSSKIDPIADNIIESITSCIDIEKNMAGNDRHAVLAAMADLRGFFSRSRTSLEKVVSGRVDYRDRSFLVLLKVAEGRTEWLSMQTEQLSAEQRELVSVIAQELPAFESHARAAIRIMDSNQSDLARSLLESETVPIANRILSELDEVVAENVEMMRTNGQSVHRLGNLAVGTSLLMMACLATIAVRVSLRQAGRFCQPIRTLASVARKVAEGMPVSPVTHDRQDEIGELSDAFNQMTTRLVERTNALVVSKEDLIRQDELLNSIIQNAPIAIMIADPRGHIFFSNHAAEELFGYDQSQACDVQVSELLVSSSDRPAPSPLEAHFRPGGQVGAVVFQEQFKHRNGREFTGDVSVNAIETRDGTNKLITVVDLSEKLRNETIIRESREKALSISRTKSMFVANMSHEIRTPLNGIIGLTELVLDTKLQDHQRDYLRMVKSSADSLLALINDILDFSKIEAGKLELEHCEFRLRDVLGDAIRVVSLKAQEKHLELVACFDENVPDLVKGDPHRLRQVVVNLLSNAVKFTESGEVILDVSVDNRDSEEVGIHIQVRDTGMGIPEHKLGTIFGAFSQVDTSTTRKFGGTGLGLAISSRIVELMNGHIWVESQSGGGSNFQFTARLGLPVERAGKSGAPAGRSNERRFDGQRLLVVDGNASSRRMLLGAAAGWKLDAVAVIDAKEAMGALEKGVESGRPYSVAVINLELDDSSGFDLASEIRANRQLDCKIVLMIPTSDASRNVVRCQRAGIDAHVLKPIKQAELCHAISRALGFKSARDEEERAAQAEQDLKDLDILLVEDSYVNQLYATALLRKWGCQVTVASDGSEGLSALEKKSYDVVLMDIQMPVMDGFQATSEIRTREAESGGHQRIVAMTAHAIDGYRADCLAAGMDDYISKPIDAEHLRAVLSQSKNSDEEVVPVEIEQPAPVNNDVFDREATLGRMDNDLDFYQEMLHAFLSESEQMIEGMKTAIEQGDAETLRRLAHSLKSASAGFFATEVAEQARGLEEVGKEGALERAMDDWTELSASLDQLNARFRKEIDELRVTMS